MNRMQLLKIAIVCCPVFAGGVTCGIVGVQFARENALKAEKARLSAQARLLEQTVQAMNRQGHAPRIACVAASPQEQTEFLKLLRGYAGLHRVQIARWADAPPPDSNGAADSAKLARPSGVTAIVSQIDARGAYNDSRQFMYALLRSPRLFTLNDVKWTRGERGITVTTFSLTRYVTASSK